MCQATAQVCEIQASEFKTCPGVLKCTQPIVTEAHTLSVKSEIVAINKRATHATEGHLFYNLGGQQIALSDR